MRRIVLFVLLLSLALAVSCSSGGGNTPNPDDQVLEKTTFVAGANTRTLHLLGPRTATFGNVTYYIFGNDDDFGDDANVPLQADRHDEMKIGPLNTGEEMRNVDLTPWDAYDNVYVRALGVVPNRVHAIRFGKVYEFTTN